MFPPGGVWSQLIGYDLKGTAQKSIYAPENKSSGASAITSDGEYLWVSYGTSLYRIRP
jgi:hypothetical protein